MTKADLKINIRKELEAMPEWRVKGLWNQYCDDNLCFEVNVYNMDGFNQAMIDIESWEVAEMIYNGCDFNPYDKYFWFDETDIIHSGNNPFVPFGHIDLAILVEYIQQRTYRLGWYPIDKLLEEYDGSRSGEV